MTGQMPRLRAASRFALESYPLSVIAAWRDVGPDIEENLEIATITGFTAGQMKGERQAAEIDLEVDFRREAAARAAERLIVLPPFAPAAETWARTTVESNICTRCAVSLMPASALKKASKVPDWLN